MVTKMGSNISVSSASSKTSLQPSHVAGGYEYLKSLSKSSRGQKDILQYDSGPIDNDVNYLEDSLDQATVAAIKCEWERVGTWEQFECPSGVLRQKSPALMKSELEKATQNYIESSIPASVVKGGRGRGKAKGSSKKFAVVLSNAMTILTSVAEQKSKELATRKQSYEMVIDYKKNDISPCTCWYSSSAEIMCRHCRATGKKNEVSHTITLRKNSKGKLGLRFHGDWAPMLAEIKHGYPAADVTELERFLEYRVSHVNGKPIGGSAQLLKVISNSTTSTVVMSFHNRMLDYSEATKQYQIQLKAGRGPPTPIGPSKEEIQISRDKRRQLSTKKVRPVVEAPLQKSESLVAAMRRRWTAARNDQLNLENMVVTTEDHNMNTGMGIFRFVTSVSQRNAISEQAAAALRSSQSESVHSGHPPPGIFTIHDIRSFYPPLLSSSKRRGVKLSRSHQKAVHELESFIKTGGARLDCFVVVVDEIKHGAPKYYEAIPDPIDLSTIIGRVNNVLYETLDQIKVDCDTVWQNCRRYNPDHHWLHKASLDLERELDISWQSSLSSLSGDSLSSFTAVAKPTSSTPAGKVFARLADAPPYSSSFFRITDYLDTVPNSYNLCAEPCPENPQLTDIVVELNPSKITEQVSKTIIAMLDRNKMGADDDVGGRRKVPKYG